MKKKHNELRFGFLIDSIDMNLLKHVMEGIQATCKENNIKLLVYTGAISYDRNVPKGLYYFVKRYIYKDDIDGLMVFTGGIAAHYGFDYIKEIIKSIKDIPIVSISTELPGYSSILVDNEMGITQIFDHLFHDHGFTKIAFIKGPKDHDESQIRYKTYLKCLKNKKIAFDDKLVVQGDRFSEPSGYKAAQNLIDNIENIDAIMAADDCTAIGVIQCLKDNNISVPDDITVTGFDDIETSKFHTPSLTTVVQPFYDLGAQSIKCLLDIIKYGDNKEVIKLPTKLIRRDSCGYSEYKRRQEDLNKYTELDKKTMRKGDDLIEYITCNIQPDSPNAIQILANKLKSLVLQDYNEQTSLTCWPIILKELFFRLENTQITWDFKWELNRTFNEIVFGFMELEKQSKNERDKRERCSLYFLSHEILSTFKKDELLKILYKRLPEFNIKGFYLCLYDRIYSDNEIEEIRDLPVTTLQLIYNEELDTEKYKGLNISDNKVLPVEILNQESELNFFPVYFNGLHFGYILFNLDSKVMIRLYDILRISIGSALHSCYLMSQLENSVDQKTNFLVNLTHEIKTPLTIITSYLDKYIRKPDDLNDINIAIENVDKLSRDINNILDYEKLDKGQVFYNHNQIINLSQYLNEKLRSFKEIISDSNISYIKSIDDECYVKMDTAALDRVLNNLIENAIKYNVQNGIIGVTLTTINSKIELEIYNTGQLISESDEHRIFDPYYQISETKSNYQGIGMGLSLVKEIVEDADCSIKLQPKNGNTCFVVSFPLAHYDKIKKQKKPVFKVKQPSIDPVKEYINSYNPSRNTILVVEDNEQMLNFLISQLNPLYNVYSANNPGKALLQIDQMPKPDIIISDMMMDSMNGLEFFEALQKRSRFKDVPFLFLSAKDRLETKLKALKMGAVDYITKPFSLQLLLHKIESLLQLYNLQKNEARDKLKRDLYLFLEDKQENNRLIQPSQLTQIFTQRELDAIRFIEKGMLYKEIASEMDISINTLKTYIKRIYAKAGVNNKVELLRKMKWDDNPIF